MQKKQQSSRCYEEQARVICFLDEIRGLSLASIPIFPHRMIPARVFAVLFVLSAVWGMNVSSVWAQSSNLPAILLDDSWEIRWGDSPKDNQGRFEWVMQNPHIVGEPVEEGVSNAGWMKVPHLKSMERPDGQHFIWYRKRLPEEIPQGSSLYIQGVYTAMEVYLKGVKVGGVQDLDHPSEFRFDSDYYYSIPAIDKYAGEYIYVRIWSAFPKIGLRGTVLIVEEKFALSYLLHHTLVEFLVGSITVFLSICTLILCLMLRDRLLFWVGLYTFALGVNIIDSSELRYQVVDYILFEDIQFVSLCFMILSVYGFIWSQFGEGKWKINRAVFLSHAVIVSVSGFIYTLGVGKLLSFDVLYTDLHIIRFLVDVAPIIAISQAVLTTQGQVVKSWLPLGGFALVMAPMVLGGMAQWEIVEWQPEFRWLSLGALLGMGFLVVKRYQNTVIALKTTTRELSIKTQEKDWVLRDLHDGISGLTANIVMMSQRKEEGSDQAKETLRTINAISRESMLQIKMLMRSMDEKEVDWRVIAAELRRHGRDMVTQHGIEFHFKDEIQGEPERPNSLFFVNLFRLYNEALTNVVKHAQARKTKIVLHVQEDSICLSISDDGQGIGETPTFGRGLYSMNSRAKILGGELQLESAKNGATVRLVVGWPMRLGPNTEPPASNDEIHTLFSVKPQVVNAD